MKFPIDQSFKLSDIFIEKYKNKPAPFGFNGLGEFVYMRCVTIDTPVLCSDFTWRDAGKLKEGDELIALTEEPVTKNNERQLCLSKVTHNEIQDSECLGIELENGEILYCTPEHRWLAKTSHGFQWVMAKDLKNGVNGASIYLPKFVDVTHEDKSYESGYLSAAFDMDKFNLTLRTSVHLKVVNVFEAGIKEIAVLSTSSKTHITAGFPSHNTYSRIKEDGKNEQWFETVRRVIEGIFSIQKQHIEDYGLGWNQTRAQKSAQEMYDRIFNFKMLPAGRSLWAMGADVVMKKGLTESLYNCCFLSTKDISNNVGIIFANAMDFLMCGIGVGADVLGADKVKIKSPIPKLTTHTITDDREGWVLSLDILINSFFGGNEVEFDYSLIREAGKPIKSFGGVSAGHEPLKEMHEKIREILSSNIDNFLSARNITDIFNLIGKAVVSGNVRRSAEIIIGNPSDEFLDLKDYAKNPDRQDFGWASNNSIFAVIGMDYKEIAKRTVQTAEPGYVWMENAKKYGRMQETEANNKDIRVDGFNPCGEIALENSELCNLVELFPTNHETLDDFKTTIKYAYLYAKSITLLNTHWQDTNRVMLRNRRIGLSMTGITQFISKMGINTLKIWMEEGYSTTKKYDKIYSEWFAIPESIKITTLKPSGTLSLLAGVTPGIHFPQSKYYIRRVRLAKNSPFVKVLKDSGYRIEDAFGQEESTVVTEFPVSLGDEIRTQKDVSIWEQLSLAAFAQKYWSDNGVSITVTFKKEEEKDIENALNLFQFSLKAVSFLPYTEEGVYKQMPYEEITKEKYEEILSKTKPINFSELFSVEADVEKYCSNDGCGF